MSKKWIVLVILLTLIVAGCTGKKTTVTTSDGDTNIEVNIPEGSQEDWCPVGASWQASNPTTGEMVSMEVQGITTLDGVEMCLASLATNTGDDIVKIEYLWSEDGERFEWNSYDASGNVVSRVSMKDGKMTIMDEEGNIMDFGVP